MTSPIELTRTRSSNAEGLRAHQPIASERVGSSHDQFVVLLPVRWKIRADRLVSPRGLVTGLSIRGLGARIHLFASLSGSSPLSYTVVMRIRATRSAIFTIMVIGVLGLIPGAASLSGLSSTAAEPPRTSSPIPSPVVSSPVPSPTVALVQMADAISRVGTTQFASSFGGVEFNASGNGLIVHLVAPSPSLESALLKAASVDPAMVAFATATRTYASLTALNNLVTKRFASLHAEGIDIRSSGMGPGLKEIISVRGLTAAISDKIHQEFGNDVVVVEAGPDGILAVQINRAAL